MGELNRLIPGYLTHSLEVGTRSDLEREEVNGSEGADARKDFFGSGDQFGAREDQGLGAA